LEGKFQDGEKTLWKKRGKLFESVLCGDSNWGEKGLRERKKRLKKNKKGVRSQAVDERGLELYNKCWRERSRNALGAFAKIERKGANQIYSAGDRTGAAKRKSAM